MVAPDSITYGIYRSFKVFSRFISGDKRIIFRKNCPKVSHCGRFVSLPPEFQDTGKLVVKGKKRPFRAIPGSKATLLHHCEKRSAPSASLRRAQYPFCVIAKSEVPLLCHCEERSAPFCVIARSEATKQSHHCPFPVSFRGAPLWRTTKQSHHYASHYEPACGGEVIPVSSKIRDCHGHFVASQ
jgi:hypothetical protein